MWLKHDSTVDGYERSWIKHFQENQGYRSTSNWRHPSWRRPTRKLLLLPRRRWVWILQRMPYGCFSILDWTRTKRSQNCFRYHGLLRTQVFMLWLLQATTFLPFATTYSWNPRTRLCRARPRRNQEQHARLGHHCPHYRHHHVLYLDLPILLVEEIWLKSIIKVVKYYLKFQLQFLSE